MKSYSNLSLMTAPFVYTRLPVLGMNIAVLSLLGIQILILAITADFYAILNITAAVMGVLCVENLLRYLASSKFGLSIEMIISGLLIGFFMPTGIGFVFVFILFFYIFDKTLTENLCVRRNRAELAESCCFCSMCRIYFPSRSLSSADFGLFTFKRKRQHFCIDGGKRSFKT